MSHREDRMNTQIILIGGAPGAGKSTLGFALASKLGVNSLTVDDLVTAAVAITTPETHHGLHAMRKIPHVEYFTNGNLEQFKADAMLRHEATLPMVERVIRKYLAEGSGIVMDGWHMNPKWFAELALENVKAYWLVVDEKVLHAREAQNEYFQQSPNPDKMLANFLARSYWYNDLIKQQATELQMHILYQTGDISVEQLCQRILEH